MQRECCARAAGRLLVACCLLLLLVVVDLLVRKQPRKEGSKEGKKEGKSWGRDRGFWLWHAIDQGRDRWGGTELRSCRVLCVWVGTGDVVLCC